MKKLIPLLFIIVFCKIAFSQSNQSFVYQKAIDVITQDLKSKEKISDRHDLFIHSQLSPCVTILMSPDSCVLTFEIFKEVQSAYLFDSIGMWLHQEDIATRNIPRDTLVIKSSNNDEYLFSVFFSRISRNIFYAKVFEGNYTQNLYVTMFKYSIYGFEISGDSTITKTCIGYSNY